MKKTTYFCDICGKEVKDGLDLVKLSLQRFEIRDIDDENDVCKACRVNIAAFITGMKKEHMN